MAIAAHLPAYLSWLNEMRYTSTKPSIFMLTWAAATVTARDVSPDALQPGLSTTPRRVEFYSEIFAKSRNHFTFNAHPSER